MKIPLLNFIELLSKSPSKITNDDIKGHWENSNIFQRNLSLEELYKNIFQYIYQRGSKYNNLKVKDVIKIIKNQLTKKRTKKQLKLKQQNIKWKQQNITWKQKSLNTFTKIFKKNHKIIDNFMNKKRIKNRKKFLLNLTFDTFNNLISK